MTVIARWESRSGKHWVELATDGAAYRYRAPDAGGYLAEATKAEAMAEMNRRVAAGYFQPDANKTPMKQVA